MVDDTPDPPARHASTPAAGALSRWLAPAALLVAVVALGLAAWSLQAKPLQDAPPVANSASVEQAGEPDAGVCKTFDTVSRAVSGQTNLNLGPDPVAQAAVAGNARLALLGGGAYLLSRVGSATSADLADAVRSFADDLQYIGINALAGVPNSDPDLSGRLTQADGTRMRIIEMCR